MSRRSVAAISVSSSIRIIRTRTFAGSFRIGPAQLVVDGATYSSAVATLTVQPHRQDLPYNTPDDYERLTRGR